MKCLLLLLVSGAAAAQDLPPPVVRVVPRGVEAPVVTRVLSTVPVVEGPYRSPPGFHRHVSDDGLIVEHADNSPDHTGMSRVQYTGPLAPGQVQIQSFSSGCPNGNCSAAQPPVRRGFFRR